MRLRVTGLLAAPVRLAAAGAVVVAVSLMAAACYRRPAPAAAPASYASVVSAPDRTAEDRALDAGRKPAELLAFAGIRPGMRVAELGAAGGYTTELLARAVGPKGKVYGQNSRFVLDRFAEKPWSERLTRPAMGNVVRVDRDFDDPLPPDARNLDAVVIVLFYHDTYWMGVDRGRMNRAVYEHLRPGGLYIVVDHSGRPGTGSSEVQSLHRIEEQTLRDDVERAGFKLVRTADFLRNPADPRDWNDSPRVAGEKRGTSDRFVLAFEKP
jgi:predicted methyltransferase